MICNFYNIIDILYIAWDFIINLFTKYRIQEIKFKLKFVLE